MNAMKDYHDFYSKCGVFLWADVFEKCRNNSLKSLDYDWDKVWAHQVYKLECNSSNDKIWVLAYYRSLQVYILWKRYNWGIYYIFDRYSKANNKNLKSYDLKQESNYITYLDANNLYGYAMTKFLPTSGFKWKVPKGLYLNKYISNSLKGCALEYPKELSKLYDHYPLAPDKIEVKREMLSNYDLLVKLEN